MIALVCFVLAVLAAPFKSNGLWYIEIWQMVRSYW